MLFLLSAEYFFRNQLFEIFFQEYHQSVKQLWFQIRPDLSADDTLGKQVNSFLVTGDL